jgi:hypothetical protein
VNSSCPNCGGTFSAEEFNAPSCKYCGKVLPNYAQAAQKVAQVQALMSDSDGSGIPNALKGMVGPYAPFPSATTGAAVPPPYGGPYAGPPVQGIPPAYGAAAAAIPAMVHRAQRRILWVILLAVFVPMIFMMLIGAAIWIAARPSAPPPPATHSGRH